MGTIAFGLLGDMAYDHEGYVEAYLRDGSFAGSSSREIDALKTGKLTAACECGWHSELTWDNDADTPGGWPSDALENEIMKAWRDHVRAVADRQPAPDPAAMAHQIAADVRELANAIRPGTVHTVYPSHLYRSLAGLRETVDAIPRFLDHLLETLRRHESAGRLYSDHGTLDTDLATLTSELDQTRSGLAEVHQTMDAAVAVARNLGYHPDNENE